MAKATGTNIIMKSVRKTMKVQLLDTVNGLTRTDGGIHATQASRLKLLQLCACFCGEFLGTLGTDGDVMEEGAREREETRKT